MKLAEVTQDTHLPLHKIMEYYDMIAELKKSDPELDCSFDDILFHNFERDGRHHGLRKLIESGMLPLRQVCEPVDFNDPDQMKALPILANKMFDCMQKNSGGGVAASQMKVMSRVFAMYVPQELRIYNDVDYVTSCEDLQCEKNELLSKCEKLICVNPEFLVLSSVTATMKESCMSVPIPFPVVRPISVKMKFQDIHGKEHILCVTDYMGKCVQHETDHLNGVTQSTMTKRKPDMISKQEYTKALKKTYLK